jgi:hypothetical protein
LVKLDPEAEAEHGSARASEDSGVIGCREDSSGWEDGVAIVIAETGSPSL